MRKTENTGDWRGEQGAKMSKPAEKPLQDDEQRHYYTFVAASGTLLLFCLCDAGCLCTRCRQTGREPLSGLPEIQIICLQAHLPCLDRLCSL